MMDVRSSHNSNRMLSALFYRDKSRTTNSKKISKRTADIDNHTVNICHKLRCYGKHCQRSHALSEVLQQTIALLQQCLRHWPEGFALNPGPYKPKNP